MVAALGQSNAVQRFYFDPDLGDEDRSILVSTGLVQLAVSGLLVTGVGLLVLAGLGSDWVTDLGLSRTLLLVTLALVLPEQLSQYLLDSVRLHFSPAKFFLIALVKNLGGVLLGLLFLIWFDLGVLGVVLGILVAAILAVPVGLVLLRDDQQILGERQLPLPENRTRLRQQFLRLLHAEERHVPLAADRQQ